MRNHTHRLALAAALAAAGAAFSPTPALAQQQASDAQAQQAREARDASARSAAAATFPAGIQAKKADDINDVRKTLDGLTEAAVTKDGFDDLIERLVDQDRNRIGANRFAEKKFDDLNAKADQLRQAWKAKYGKDFEIHPSDAFAMVQVIQGEVQEPAALAGNWPVKAASASASDRAVTAGERETRTSQDPATGAPQGTANANADNSERREPLAKNEDANLTKGREVAIATFPASHGLPQLNVSLVGEAQGWRVDAPNTLTGQQLHDNLLKHLTHVTDMSAQWPADVKQAEMAVAHHILAAVYGVDQTPSRDRSQSSGAASDRK